MILFRDTLSFHGDHVPNFFQIPLCTAKLWPGHDSGTHTNTHTHTHTHTHGQGKHYMPFRILWRGHNKRIVVIAVRLTWS